MMWEIDNVSDEGEAYIRSRDGMLEIVAYPDWSSARIIIKLNEVLACIEKNTREGK